MLTKSAREELERQQYRVVGSHSAVKVCGWTKNMIKGEGGCYKLTFYGIMSNQCMQMTTSISCANRCTFCWRGYKAPVSKKWRWGIDEPDFILDNSIAAHHKLLEGFGGNPKASKAMYKKSKDVRHVALSLTGEPIIYPKFNAFLAECNKKHISTFVVTNAQYPEAIRDLNPVTQLYISLDAPNKPLLKIVDVPLFADYWERLLTGLDYMSQKKYRTTIRLTMIKGLNDVEPESYASLIKRGDPDFIEIKGYMYVGESRERLKKENMPTHEEVVEWSKKVAQHLDEYDIVSEHIPSRVTLLAKTAFFVDDAWHTWIDFDKYHDIVINNKEMDVFSYMKKTPKVGLSGKGTKEYIALRQRRKEKKKASN